MMVDDAHSSGVLGRNGRGTVDHFGLHGRVHIQVGTLSKAIGVLGGYVCGSRDLIDYLYHRARPFLFSTSHPPPSPRPAWPPSTSWKPSPSASSPLGQHPLLQGAARQAGLRLRPHSETPITPIMVGDGRNHAFTKALFEEGLFATGIGFPTVPEGKARIRTIVTATTPANNSTAPSTSSLPSRRS